MPTAVGQPASHTMNAAAGEAKRGLSRMPEGRRRQMGSTLTIPSIRFLSGISNINGEQSFAGFVVVAVTREFYNQIKFHTRKDAGSLGLTANT